MFGVRGLWGLVHGGFQKPDIVVLEREVTSAVAHVARVQAPPSAMCPFPPARCPRRSGRPA